MYEPPLQHQVQTSSPYGMKWFKFLVNFSLFAGALLMLSDAIRYINGSIYLSQGLTQYQIDGLYARYPSHKALDVAYAIFYFLFAVYYIIVRFRLAQFRNKAPNLFLLIPLLSIVVLVTYDVLSCKILALEVTEVLPQIAPALLRNGIYYWLNSIYFNKRRHLFVN